MTEDDIPDLSDRPWIVLDTTYDVEAWMDSYNRDLQRVAREAGLKPNATGYGICFGLGHGGEIYMHTMPEGDIVLDVTPEAEWVAPLIAAATGTEPPRGQIWPLPGEKLTQLVLGLSSLIATTRIVLDHDFRIRKRW
ncbi:hypothetical protein SAMN06265795_102628 [Noviherbaspirillum humi]|uniref:Uncharacterized protein n=1 Tax=Noviherbaspirillum humi TaxID=1688639 RepID=A0A239EBB5_9BURK|nr:hypothetical protein [Noviherbaspirillum humi]SNS42050.1 hypothetical protein SAMN06265795_102628 [Noviherbaspirillum humi]